MKDFKHVNGLNTLSRVSNSDPAVQFLFLDGDDFVELARFKSLVVYIWDPVNSYGGNFTPCIW